MSITEISNRIKNRLKRYRTSEYLLMLVFVSVIVYHFIVRLDSKKDELGFNNSEVLSISDSLHNIGWRHSYQDSLFYTSFTPNYEYGDSVCTEFYYDSPDTTIYFNNCVKK